MACCGGGEDPVLSKRNREIEEDLQNEKELQRNRVKLLLLGPGESGKSTIAKQLKIIHMEGFSRDELISYTSIIHGNTVGSVRAVVEACVKLNINLEPSNQAIAERVLKEDYFSGELNPSIANDVKALSADEGFKAAISRSSEFQLNDSAEYYFNEVDRISQPGYVPSVADVLRSRAKTTGIIETEFVVGKTKFMLVDVGGQRSERRKWIHCFQEVTAVIFCADLAAYDRKLYEDDITNRMHEALKLFKDVCNTKYFTEVAIILFLNKRDIFAQKIQHTPLTACFSEYKGGNNYEEASQFIEDQFLAQNQNARKLIYVHKTCGTDTDNISIVFRAVQDIILNRLIEHTLG